MNALNIQNESPQTLEQLIFMAMQNEVAMHGYDKVTYQDLERETCIPADEIETMYPDRFELCRLCLLDAQEKISDAYEQASKDALDYLSKGTCDREELWGYIDHLLYKHVCMAFHPMNRSLVLLALHEDQIPKDYRLILPKVISEKVESVFAKLIYAVGDVKNYRNALTISRCISGSVMTFVEQPVLVKQLFEDNHNTVNYSLIEDFLHDYVLRSIEAMTSVNKQF